jgi:hypothetical protein
VSLDTNPAPQPANRALRFAWYENIAPDADRDPHAATTRSRQRAAALDLMHAAHGDLVAEVVDHGPLRTPWRDRPGARALLETLGREGLDHGFDAVLIPDPATALHRTQAAEVPAILAHYGIELWTTTTAGPLDVYNDLHIHLLTTQAYPVAPCPRECCR